MANGNATASPVPTRGAVSLNDLSSATYEGFWNAASDEAEPALSSIRRRLSRFPSPPLRIQRVSQLDAELLDNELTSMLLEPLKQAMGNINVSLPSSLEPEILLCLRLVLFKFSIYDRGATYGAMLQNLRYRNEWAHRGGLQSTSRDAPLSSIQLLLFPALTIVVPYLHTKLERVMSRLNYSDLSMEDPRRRIWTTVDKVQRVHSALSLTNFLAFLSDGRYRTLTDRLLGMRLTYAQRTMNRNVSFEFLNRQLVWHAFTEFLLFLLPLVRPRRLLRKLLRLPTHPIVLSTMLALLPTLITSRLGLTRNERGQPQLRIASQKIKSDDSSISTYSSLPDAVCAICWQRLEEQASLGADATSLRAGLPSSDPLDPAGVASSEQNAQSPSPNKESSTKRGLAYADAIIHTPYEAEPCKHRYCYVCISSKLLSEEAGDELGDSNADGAWHCLRCGEWVRQAQRAFVDP